MRRLITSMISVLLVGCTPFPYSETPLATNFETSKQKKLQAAQHWMVIAHDMADTIAEALTAGKICIPSVGSCPTLYVIPDNNTTEFSNALRTGIITRLVNKGLQVSNTKGDVDITLDVQAVKFSPERSQYIGVGRLTLLGAGVWGLRQLYTHASPGAAAAGAAVAADIYEWNVSEFAKGPTPQVEIITTVSATKDGRFLARTTNVYYIADSDAELYLTRPSNTVSIRVVGDGGAEK